MQHVLNLSGRSPDLVVTVEPSLAAELLNSLCSFSFPPDYATFELGAEWFEQRRAAIPPDLLATISLFSAAPWTRLWGHLLGLAHETPAPRDVPTFLARIAATPADELRRHLLGYYGELVGPHSEALRAAGEGDEAALGAVLARQFADPDQREAVRARFFPDMEAIKPALLETLQGWYDAVFRGLEAEIAPILERDAAAKRVLLRASAPERLIDAALNGVEYVPEPGIREVVLIPSYLWRPWVVLSDHRDLKLIVYPVADESLADGGDGPPTRLVKLYKALGDERRLRTLKRLGAGNATLQELTDYLGLAKSTMHHHLAILRGAGLVRVHMNAGGEMHYSLRRDLLPTAADLLQDYLAPGVK